MRSVSCSKVLAILALVVILLAPSAFAETQSTDPSLWEQFVTWIAGATTTDGTIGFEDWLVLMGHIGVPNG